MDMGASVVGSMIIVLGVDAAEDEHAASRMDANIKQQKNMRLIVDLSFPLPRIA
jgi:hypothetical protein